MSGVSSPGYIGQRISALSVPVVISSDQSAISITISSAVVVTIISTSTLNTKEVRSTTGTIASISASSSSQTILASNTNRLGATIFNDSGQVLYLGLSTATAATTTYSVQLGGNAYYEIPFNYTGQLTGIWFASSGAARVTELS